jgi:toxin CcdB
VQQFDIVENLNPLTRDSYPFVVVLQHDRVSAFLSVVVAPLTKPGPALAAIRLHPSVSVSGMGYLVVVEQLAAVHRRVLGRKVGTADPQREIISALDLLFTGI